MHPVFKIENKEVKYSFDELSSSEIVIKSMPYDYSVSFVDADALKVEAEKLQTGNKDKHFVFMDKVVAGLYADDLFARQELMTLQAKENNKALPAVTNLLDKLQEKNFTKKETFVSVGGGITQDISAFVRAVYKRGINWTYIPTTLLAMGDSCIGAKACLNYGKIKNQLGLFSAPQKVFIYSGLLKTLDEKDVLSGYGEIIKLSIVGGEAAIQKFKELAETQNGNRLHNIEQLIKLALIVKKCVIEKDEFEKDIRKALNYGHTIGHAIEPLVNYKIPHGIAVSIGMIVENLLSSEYGSLPKNEAENLNELICPFVDKKSLKLLNSISVESVISNMKRDKKAMSNDIYMSVPFKIGHFDMLKIPVNDSFAGYLSDVLKNLAVKA